jgi:hypothetical protein
MEGIALDFFLCVTYARWGIWEANAISQSYGIGALKKLTPLEKQKCVWGNKRGGKQKAKEGSKCDQSVLWYGSVGGSLLLETKQRCVWGNKRGGKQKEKEGSKNKTKRPALPEKPPRMHNTIMCGLGSDVNPSFFRHHRQ